MSKNLAVALGVAKANSKKDAVSTETTSGETSRLADLDYKALAQAILQKMGAETPEEDELPILDDEDEDDLFDSDDTRIGESATEEKSPLATIMSRHFFKGGAK